MNSKLKWLIFYTELFQANVLIFFFQLYWASRWMPCLWLSIWFVIFTFSSIYIFLSVCWWGFYFHFAAILSFSLNALLIVTLMKVPRQLTHLELCLINLAAGSCVPSLTSYPIIASACYSHRWLFGPIGKYVKVLIWKVKCGRHGWLFGSTVSA